MASERKSHAGTRLRRTLSLAFQSPLRKRERYGILIYAMVVVMAGAGKLTGGSVSVARQPTPPTCEERIHYPVYNSRDPRHNPEAASFSDFDLPENSQGTERRKRSFPIRSLRKVQSGLLALKSGMHRRPREQNARHSLPSTWSPAVPAVTAVSQDGNRGSSEREGAAVPLIASDVSTENEHGFGTDLYRTREVGSSTEELVHAYSSMIGTAITDDSAVDLPELDVGSNVRLDGETLHEVSEEEEAGGNFADSDTTREETKGPSITWDESHLNRFPSSHSNSGYIDSSSTETSSSSEESSDSRIITEANDALDALYLLDPSSNDRGSSPDVGPSIGFHRDVQEDKSTPDSPTLPPEEPARLRLNAEHSTFAGNNEQAGSEPQANEIETVEEVEQTEAKESQEQGQDEQQQQHPSEEAKEADSMEHTEPEEATMEASGEEKTNESSFLELVPTEITARPLEFLENITDTSSIQYTESRYSASLSNGDSSTSPTSARLSVDITYPVEYDELVTLPSLNIGDEYMYDDGKQNTFSPDQDCTPIKSDSMILRHGSVDTVRSIDRALSITMRNHSPQLVCPGSIYQQPPRQSPRVQSRLQRSRGTSDSEDGYLTYSMFQRQYG